MVLSHFVTVMQVVCGNTEPLPVVILYKEVKEFGKTRFS